MTAVSIDSAKLNALKKLSWVRFTFALASEYVLIFALLFGGHAIVQGPLWAWILAPILWALVASRQHALLILMHDATHGLACRRVWLNEIVGEVFCGGPVFVSMMSYRRDHLGHHKWMNTEKDPDWRRKRTQADVRAYWTFPVSRANLAYWLNLWGHSIAFQLWSLKDNASESSQSAIGAGASKLAHRMRLASYGVLAILLTVSGFWIEFLVFWLIPAVLFLPLIMRIRSIAEHFAVRHQDELSEARNVIFGTFVEKLFFAPHNVAYHLDHHLFADVPFYRLPALHAELNRNEEFRKRAHQNDGYFLGKMTLKSDLESCAPARSLWPT